MFRNGRAGIGFGTPGFGPQGFGAAFGFVGFEDQLALVFEVVELAGLQSPGQDGDQGQHQQYRQRNQKVENIHGVRRWRVWRHPPKSVVGFWLSRAAA